MQRIYTEGFISKNPEQRRAEHIYKSNFKNVIELAYRGPAITPIQEATLLLLLSGPPEPNKKICILSPLEYCQRCLALRR